MPQISGSRCAATSCSAAASTRYYRIPAIRRFTGPTPTTPTDYVQLAERKHGPIPAVRGFDYVWGDALAEFDAFAPDLRLINLETAITAQGKPWPRKPIHYRMNPQNIDVLVRAKIDFCSLANNHVMDWGYVSMGDTMKALASAGIARAGAGRDRARAAAPAILHVPGKGRVDRRVADHAVRPYAGALGRGYGTARRQPCRSDGSRTRTT